MLYFHTIVKPRFTQFIIIFCSERGLSGVIPEILEVCLSLQKQESKMSIHRASLQLFVIDLSLFCFLLKQQCVQSWLQNLTFDLMNTEGIRKLMKHKRK